MSVKACIFDLDGTLLDTLEDLANSCNAALRAVGLPERSLDEVRAFVGNGVRKLMTRAVPPASDQATIETLPTPRFCQSTIARKHITPGPTTASPRLCRR